MPAFDVPANYAFDSYDALVSAINDWLDRTDLDGSAQGMIALAEARLRRELTPLFSEVGGTVACVEGIGALPADCSTLARVIYDGSVLPQLSSRSIGDYGDGARPCAYTLEAGGLRLWPALTATVSVLYQPALVSLSEGTPNNELLDKHPDLYFFGALLFAEGYLANDSRAAVFKGLWDEALAEARRYFMAQRYAGPLVPRAYVP